MADEKVVIKIEVNADNRQIDQTTRKLRKMGAATALANTAGMSSAKSQNKTFKKVIGDTEFQFKRHFDALDGMVKGFGKALTKSLAMIMKFSALEFGAMALALVGVHAAFAAGQIIMKAYRATMGLVAGGVAAAGVAIASVAAALREQQAAMFAYKTTAKTEFGSSMNQTRQVMRALQMDSSLATVGVENLNKAFAAVSKTSTFSAGSQRMLKGLMDFASAGQPIEEGIQKAGELIAVLQDTKKSYSDVQNAAKALGPEMEKAMAEAAKKGIDTKQELIDAINSGQLATLGGVTGQFDAVSGTLISQLKGFFNVVRGQFADMGQPFLEPLKVAAQDIFRIFERGLAKTAGMTRSFGLENVISSVVRMAEKLEKFYVNTMFKYLGQADGIFQRMGDWWDRFTHGWNRVLDVLRPFIDGAKVIEKTLGRMWKPVAEEGAKGFKMINSEVQKNEKQFLEFGDKVGLLLASLMQLGKRMKELYIDLLPFINKLLDGAKMMIDYFTGLLGTLSRIGKVFGGNEFGAFFALMGLKIVGRQMGMTKGGFLMNAVGPARGGVAPGYGPVQTGGPGGVYGSSAAAVGGLGQVAQTLKPSSGAVYKGPGDGMASGKLSLAPGQFGQKFQQALNNNKITGGIKGYRDLVKGGMSRRDALGYAIGSMPKKQPGTPGIFRTLGAGARGLRENSKLLKFNQSGTGMLATSMGLSLASQYASKEAQGAFALGSMVASVNPLLGLGVAGLGTAMSARTAAGGALSGAAGGAAIGSMIAPGVGTVIGAALGGITGGISGWIRGNSIKKKEAKKNVVNALNESVFGGINEAAKMMRVGSTGQSTVSLALKQVMNNAAELQNTISKANIGDSQDAARALLQNIFDNQEQYGVKISQAELNTMMQAPVTAVEKFASTAGDQFTSSGIVLDAYTRRMDYLQTVTGKSEQELVDLARTLGVNLMDVTVDLRDQMNELGIAVQKTASQIKASVTDMIVNNQSIFDTAINKLNAPEIMSERARALRDRIDAGDMPSQQEILEYLKNTYNDILAYNEGDIFATQSQFEKIFGQGGTAFTQKGGVFEGMEGIIRGGGIGGTLDAFSRENRTVIAQELGNNINAQLEKKGLALDTNIIENAVKGMSASDFQLVSNFLQTGGKIDGLVKDVIGVDEKGRESVVGKQLDLSRIPGLGNVNLSEKAVTTVNKDALSTGVAEEMQKFIDTMGDTIFAKINTISNAPEWFSTPPEWFNKESFEALTADTSTPRGDTTSSRLSQTMARHSQLNSMLTGSRSVTSSYRTVGLGSINSDHITGRAYDLVGQNLGQYQRLVQQTGGFAEFHGVNGSRHLHVVPRADRMGDTATATVAPPQSTGSMSSGGNNYYFTVTGGPNANAEDVANMVMAKIRSAERSRRERR